MDRLLTASDHPARGSLTAYKRYIWPRYQHPAHLQLLDAALMRVSSYAETQGKRGTWMLIVEMPPRHGKTKTVSELFPTWHLGRNPDHRIILVSYGATLAHRSSRRARAFMQSAKYKQVFGIELEPTRKAADAWDIAHHEGGCDAMGVLGGATGKGANILIGDDLVKNREEAESEVIRERTWEALNDDLLTRLEPGGSVVLFATRWHLDDPIGRMLNLLQVISPPGPVERINLPALAEEGDPIGRQPDEALWPGRFDVGWLRATQARMGEYSFGALYQQRPVPAEGGLFKRNWFYPPVDHVPEIVYACRFWDLAMSEKTSADYTASVKVGQATDGHYYILDVVRKQIDWGNLTDWMADIVLADGAIVPQGIEEKGYMSRAIEELNADPRLHGYQIWGYPVDGDKWVRALPVAAKLASGNLHMCAGHWNREFVEELCLFNKGAHDDQVDALSGVWAMLDPDTGLGELHLADQSDFGIGPY